MLIYRKINEYLKDKNQFFNLIDYTKTSDNLTNDNIKDMCKDAENNNVYGVCVPSKNIAITKSLLPDNIKLISVIGLPNGRDDVKSKLHDMEESMINGANEIDVLINYNFIKEKDKNEKLEDEIRQLTEFCHKEGGIIKIIIETGALDYQEIESICKMCINNSVDFVMTSSGKLPNDDTFEEKVEKVKYMRKILPDDIKIKFSGGIRNYNQIKEITSYIDRIGASLLNF
jgi:deoxyribose-phosphate aldolase